MKISKAGIKLIACGALVAVGLTVGSGTAHAATVLPEPTADQCQSYAQFAIDEGEGETLAQELEEHGLNPAGCPAPAPDCHEVKDLDGDYDCNSDDVAPVPVPTPDCHEVKDLDGDYDCNSDDVATTATTATTAATRTGASESGPTAAVQGVTVSNAAPAAVSAATPAKAATLSTPVLAAAATPAATAKALPLTGGDLTGIILLAFAGLGIGGALLLVDKRRRTA